MMLDKKIKRGKKMNDKKFPIYVFSLRWNQIGYNNNGIEIRKMYLEEPNEDQLAKDLIRFKKTQEEKDKFLDWISFNYTYVEHETWMLEWFSHITYNTFDSDEEIEESFQNFIDRKIELNHENGHFDDNFPNWIGTEYSKKPFYCFMGANERWRWKICKCDHCKKNGTTIISH